MSDWYTLRARFTAEEMKVLEDLKQKYGFNHTQSLRKGIELLGRFIAMGEFYANTDSKILKTVSKISDRNFKELNKKIEKALVKYPKKDQEEQYEKMENNKKKTLEKWDVFSTERKRGRKSEKRKRGRPRTRS